MSAIMLIEDDRALSRSLEIQLTEQGHEIRTAASASEGLEALAHWTPDLLLLDLGLPDRPGLEVLETVRGSREDLPVVIITGRQEMQSAITAMRQGAFDYLRKPFDFEEILILIQKVERFKSRLKSAAKSGLAFPETENDYEIVGADRKILEVIKKIGLLSRSRVSVLIEGESGTGKELVARAIHHASSPDQPFVALNCSSLVGTLLESELFGHEKGAFTGALSRKTGRLEHAGEGVVFLDEIGDMPPALQSKLLRVLQECEFERVGGLESIPFKARVVAATHRNLQELIQQGLFREDLYYRLTVSRISLPPLRERRGDIPGMAGYLIRRIGRKLHRRIEGLDPSALAALQRYDWPGNVRELENVLTRAAALARGPVIAAEEIESYLGAGVPADSGRAEILTLSQAEKAHIEKALAVTGWNLSRTARLLEISPTTLRKKIKDYALRRPL